MRRRDEHGGALSKLLWFVIVVAVLLVVADRGGAYAAERVAAQKLQSAETLSSRPDVAITGFPFLTQFASGRYEHVRVTAHGVSTGTSSSALVLSRLRVDFRTVTASRDFSSFHARRATAHATVSYPSLGRRLGAKVSYTGNGRIKAGKQFTVLGQKISPSITLAPSLTGDVLSFAATTTNGLQGAPPQVADALRGIGIDVPLRGLPFHVKVTSLRADKRGLELSLSGKDLSYSR